MQGFLTDMILKPSHIWSAMLEDLQKHVIITFYAEIIRYIFPRNLYIYMSKSD